MTNKSNLAYICEPSPSTDGLEYDEALRLTELEVRKLLKNAPPLIRIETSHLARATGKGIRARALLTCSICGDGLVRRGAVNAAAAVELLHLATLIHDDIIDDADMRRGIDALHVKFGEKTAILCGDYLFCLAFDLASSISPRETDKDKIGGVLPPYLTEICLGEIREFSNTGNLDLTEREYFRIISGKTAALFQATFHAGFLLSDEPREVKDLYIEIGKQLGILFQLVDDCLDFVSSKKKAKKPILTDCRRGVVTLPLIYALRADKTLRLKIENGLSGQELKAAVIAAGGLEYTRSKIRERRSKAKKLISSLGSESKRTRLELLVDMAAAF
ncbi:MAG: polyprenyl synthetase family protein [Bacillota bacterium]